MTRYYRDLHDRELSRQAEMMLAELQRRRLLDIRLAPSPRGTVGEPLRVPVDSIVRNGNALSIVANATTELRADGQFEPS